MGSVWVDVSNWATNMNTNSILYIFIDSAINIHTIQSSHINSIYLTFSSYNFKSKLVLSEIAFAFDEHWQYSEFNRFVDPEYLNWLMSASQKTLISMHVIYSNLSRFFFQNIDHSEEQKATGSFKYVGLRIKTAITEYSPTHTFL